MELTLTVHVPRRRPHPVDVVVRWEGEQSAASLARALQAHFGVPVDALAAGGHPVPPSCAVGRPPLVHGAAVTLGVDGALAGSKPGDPTVASSVLELAVVGGPDAGRSRLLVPPGVRVGRSVPGGLTLADEALSRAHAHLRVDPSGVVVTDEGSTNGVLLDGRRLVGPCVVDSGSMLVLGGSTLRVRRLAGAGLPVREDGGGRLLLRPPAMPPDRVDDVVVEAPPAPVDRHRPRIPWVAALLPVPIALALAWFLGPQLLAFALLGPVLLLGTSLSDRWGSGRAHRRDLAEHARALLDARGSAERLVAEDAARLDRAHPDPHAVLRTAEQRLPGLWGRPDLRVRLGLGDVTTRVVWRDGRTTERPRARHGPVVVDLDESAGLAVVGPPDLVGSLLAGVVGQLLVRCPPSALQVAVASDDPAWRWVARVPHAVPPPESGKGTGEGRARVGSDPIAASSDPTAASRDRPAEPSRVLVVPTLDRAGAEALSAAREQGWVVILGTPVGRSGELGDVPALLDLVGEPVLRTPLECVTLAPDHVGPWWSDRVSRALAALVEDRREDTAGLPSRLTLSELLGGGTLTSDDVAARWAAGQGRPVAPVGAGPAGVRSIDLVADGPHVLVGGTTGAGKSEFLRTLVASLALCAAPEDLSFVLVDFKGGAAFGACTDLPHVAGVVTDLDEHLVERALTSLGAELRRRERLFATVGAADLDAYRRAPRPPEPVPRLVVVVDELKALVEEVPRFVDGLVRLAALGRSLGVHLVLATQRPAGALSSEVQANVNLRIAFRVRDRADSVDVLDDPAAAGIDPATPGRAFSRGGDGHLSMFQAALVADPAPKAAPHLTVHEAGDVPTDLPQVPLPDTPHGSASDADDALSRLVAVVIRAAADGGHRRGRRPWPAPLPTTVRAEGAGVGDRRTRIGLLDEPDRQRVSALSWTPHAGTWLLSGPPRSGRSTAARAVVLSAASSLGPAALHVHVVDPTGALSDLALLPHVGTTVGHRDHRGLRALVEHLHGLIGRGRDRDPALVGSGVDPSPERPVTLVVIDGWEQLVDGRPDQAADPVLDTLVSVLRDGAAAGVVGVVSGGRALLQPRWSGVGGQTVVLGRVDALDAALAGLRSADLPTAPPPGRGVRVADRRQLQVAWATPATTEAVGLAWPAPVSATPGARPWRHTPLPDVATRATSSLPTPGRLEVGLCLTDHGPQPWAWSPDAHGRRLLVAGPPRSGRSSTLSSIADAARQCGRPVLLVTRTPSAATEREIGRWDISPDDTTRLVEVRSRHPDLVVLVDDADRLDDAPVLPLLREVGELVDRDGGHLAVTTTTSALATRFRGLDVETARHRFGILLAPRPTDGDLLGHGRLPEVAGPCGHGLVVGGGGPPLELQVYRPGASGVAVGVRGQGVDALGREGGEGRGERHRDEAPAQEPESALDHPSTHGEEQGAPDDGRGLGPRSVTQPGAGDDDERDAEQGDEQGRHDDPDGVAALADDELVDVEDGEPQEGERLDAGQGGGDQPWTA